MSEERVTKKSDLLAHINRHWTTLNNALAQLSSAGHFAEHLAWIEALAAPAQSA